MVRRHLLATAGWGVAYALSCLCCLLWVGSAPVGRSARRPVPALRSHSPPVAHQASPVLPRASYHNASRMQTADNDASATFTSTASSTTTSEPATTASSSSTAATKVPVSATEPVAKQDSPVGSTAPCGHSSGPHLVVSVPSFQSVTGFADDDSKAPDSVDDSVDVTASGKMFTVFAISLCVDGKPHTSHRRFRDFVSFHKSLKKSFPKGRLPHAPSRTLGRTQKRQTMLERRRVALDKYFKQLLASNFREVGLVSTFLAQSTASAAAAASGSGVLESADPELHLGPYPFSSRLVVDVPSHRQVVAPNGSSHVVFAIVVEDRGLGAAASSAPTVFSSEHRFSEFLELHKHAQNNIVCTMPLPRVPSKGGLGGALRRGARSDEQLEKRRKQLAEYLQCLVNLCGHDEQVQRFIGMHGADEQKE